MQKKLFLRLFVIFLLFLILLLTFITSKREKSKQSNMLPTKSQTVSSIQTAVSSSTKKINPVSQNENLNLDESQNATSSIPSDRITYQPDFYYESIDDSVKLKINGLSYKADCPIPYEDLRYLTVLYIDFNQTTQVGELICNKKIADDLVEIFYDLYQAHYPIDKIRLIDEYQADDTQSMMDDNTSCFNYRVVDGTTTLSKHAQGVAIDINPFYNPYVTYHNNEALISPIGSEAYADRTINFEHKIDETDLCYKLFIAHGFTWGGNWHTVKDYQHFQKSID